MGCQKVVLADFADEHEYHAIKDPQGTAFETLEMHRMIMQESISSLTAQGYSVEVEICDLAGYQEFCKLQNALNTPQTVAAYVIMKHGGKEKEFQEGLDHQNIEVHKD